MNTIETLDPTPFKHLVMSIGALPTSFVDSMSYYECMAWLVAYIRDNVVPACNNNAEAIKEIQKWIETLDLQDEVDHKLDEMAESGELAEIISQYLNSTAIFGYDTVADMKSAENLIDGSYARTLGYYAKNDGGAGLYKIRTITNDDVVDEASIIEMGDGSDQLIAELIFADEISLEQFGCYGDNSNNDTTNFQKAVTFAETKKVKLTSRGDKTYKVTSPINVDTLECDLNMATVTTPDNINIFYINSENYYGMITGVTFDCTYANAGIYINNGRKKTIKNIVIKDLTSYGIYFNNGYELLIDDCHINGKTTATTGIGIYMKASDSKVSNTILIDCHTAIKNEGMNFYEYIHAWIRTATLCSGSIMFDIVNNTAIIDQCYSDTYYKTISLSSGGVAIIDQMRVFFNQSIYSSEESKPYFFYLNGITEAKRSSVTNSSINGAYSNKHIDFCNYVGVVKVSNNNLVWVDNYNGGLSYTPTTSSSAVTEVKTNNCIVKNGTMYIDILVVLDTSIGGSFEFSSIPADWRPISAINNSCSYGDSQWVQSGLGYLYINDKITGQVPTTGGSTKYVKIHLSYPIKNENS